MTGSAKQSMEPQAKMDCFVASAFARRATADKSLLAMTNSKSIDLPDGQISRRFPVQPCLKKYFA
jgi:hypothetical protein